MAARRGRLPDAERAARRREILDAAMDALVDHGYEAVTMLDVATRAGASKETLYRWFGDREGLFAELVEHNAATTVAAVQDALADGADARATLTAFATGLLTLLTGPRSVALNRAAMVAPELADVLLASGRHTVGPLVERYLAELDATGALDLRGDTDRAFRVLYGLVVRDTQVRVLLGEEPPDADGIRSAAETAVDQFIALFERQPPGRPPSPPSPPSPSSPSS